MFDFFGIAPLLKLARLRKPGMVFLVYRNNTENDMSKFVLVLPPAGAHDVVERSVSVQVNNDPPHDLSVPASNNETDEIEGNVGDTIKGSLIDVDDAGNRSEPRDFDLVIVDNLAPPKPGEVGIRLTEEDPPEVPTEE